TPPSECAAHMVGIFILTAIEVTEFVQERRIGDSLRAHYHPVDARVDELLHLFDTPDATAVLDLHIRLTDDIKQVSLVGEIAFGAVEVYDMHEFSAVGLVPLDHLFETHLIDGRIVVIALT